MLTRLEIFRATRSAAQVLENFEVRESVLHGGFTRVDTLDLAQRAGVHVMCRPLNQLLGAFIREEQPGILLNTERSVGMMHMTCAHELRHFFLKWSSGVIEALRDAVRGRGRSDARSDHGSQGHRALLSQTGQQA